MSEKWNDVMNLFIPLEIERPFCRKNYLKVREEQNYVGSLILFF